MDQESLKIMFRQQELERRRLRQGRLLNEVALAGEVLTPEDKAIDEKAVEELKRQRLAYELSLTPHFPSKLYWKRLWSALRGRP